MCLLECKKWARKTDQGYSPGQNGVHASSALPAGDCSFSSNDWLDDSGVDDAEEECSGIQSTQHIGKLPLSASAAHHMRTWIWAQALRLTQRGL